ncbi:hypothetical protein GCM10009696_36330 [Kocuria himachalensis]
MLSVVAGSPPGPVGATATPDEAVMATTVEMPGTNTRGLHIRLPYRGDTSPGGLTQPVSAGVALL